jgi:hypothetical protein
MTRIAKASHMCTHLQRSCSGAELLSWLEQYHGLLGIHVHKQPILSFVNSSCMSVLCATLPHILQGTYLQRALLPLSCSTLGHLSLLSISGHHFLLLELNGDAPFRCPRSLCSALRLLGMPLQGLLGSSSLGPGICHPSLGARRQGQACLLVPSGASALNINCTQFTTCLLACTQATMSMTCKGLYGAEQQLLKCGSYCSGTQYRTTLIIVPVKISVLYDFFARCIFCLYLQLNVSSTLPPCIRPSRTSKIVKISSKYCI